MPVENSTAGQAAEKSQRPLACARGSECRLRIINNPPSRDRQSTPTVLAPPQPPWCPALPTQGDSLSPLPTVTIGGTGDTVQFAGLISPGLFQFNVFVPTTLRCTRETPRTDGARISYGPSLLPGDSGIERFSSVYPNEKRIGPE
jgi:hypothetical protein